MRPRLAMTTALALALSVAGCATKEVPTAKDAVVGSTPPSSTEARVEFELDSIDERPVSSAATRGKPLVMVISDTGSLLGQAEIEFLIAMNKNDGDKINYAWMVLTPRSNRAEVEAFISTLGIRFPVAFADSASMQNSGPFGELHALPVTVVLDRVGRVAFRAEGRVAKSDELRAALRGL